MSSKSLEQGPPIEAGGPYSGSLNLALAYLPAAVRTGAADAGGMARLLFAAVHSAARHPRGYWSDVLDEMHGAIRRSWLAISIALFAFLLAIAVPSMQFLNLSGTGELYGPLMIVQSIRTFTVWVSALLVAGVIGASITAEIGARKVREELDAMQVMGIDPVRMLVVPRVVSVTLLMTLMGVVATVVTVFSCQFAALYIGQIHAADFYSSAWSTLSTVELIAMLLNCLLSGLLISAICCYKGMNAQGGAIGLGRAVNQAVVLCFVAIFVMQLGFNAIVLGFFPDLGAFR